MVIVCTILVFAIPINVSFFILKKYRSRISRSYVSIHGYRLATNIEPATKTSERPLHTFVDRGYLFNLPSRMLSTEKQVLHDHEARKHTQAVLALINERNPRHTYLGSTKISPKASEELNCLYARYRVNGVTKSVGKIAFIDGDCITTRIHRQDAKIIRDAGWTTNGYQKASKGLTSFIFPGQEVAEVSIYFPRTAQECQILETILDAATRFNTKAEDDA